MPDLRSQLEALRAKLSSKADARPRAIPPNPPPGGATTPQARGDRHQPATKADKQEARTVQGVPGGGIGHAGSTVGSDRGGRAPRLDIVIGLDFGTRFTKVGYRVVGVDRTQIVVPDPAKPDSALFKSVIFVDTATMTLHRRRPSGHPVAIEELPYLKLLLKDLDQPTSLVPLLLRKIVTAKSIKVISAFYLSGVLRSALAVISQKEAPRLAGRRAVYALNVSLPADHCDDAATESFKEVGTVALRWAQGSIGSLAQASLTDLTASYDADQSHKVTEFEVSVFPEIIAALYHFITRRDTPSGIHGFLDIGGGTIDGCIFDLLRERAQSAQVKILAAKVAPLGTIVVAKKALGVLYWDLERRIESEIVTRNDVKIDVPLPLERVEKELGDFVGQLLVAARSKRKGHMLLHDETAVFESELSRRELAKSFTIHMTGGGAKSGWYKGAIEQVHAQRNLTAHGIMHYRCELLRASTDFDTSIGIPFERFVIAHGLTMDAANLENLQTRLPSQLRAGEHLPEANPVSISYADTKDALT